MVVKLNSFCLCRKKSTDGTLKNHNRFIGSVDYGFGNSQFLHRGVLRWINQQWTRAQRRRFESFTEKMELQVQTKSDSSRHYFSQLPVDANPHFFCSKLRSDSVRLEGISNPYCSIWTDADPARVQSCNSWSFAMDARIRLDNLKSGCNSALERPLHNFNCPKEPRVSEPKEEESALDLVELIDVEDDVQDEERWLYESPKKQVFVEKSESALRWCRHVLDNPSPEMEAARRVLINRLNQGSNSPSCRRPEGFHHTGNATVNKTQTASDTSGYRLEDITDVHIMAHLQEASLRQDYVSTAVSSRRSSESPVMLPPYFNTKVEASDDITPGNNTSASSSSCWQPCLSSLVSFPCQSPTSAAKHSYQSPKLARLHQQVTQFKLLKLAQNQATSTDRTRSPLRTSLRSLQAVRNSRSLDVDDCHPADQNYPPAGASSARLGSSCWPPSLPAASMNSSGLLHSLRDSSVRTAAIKTLQRSQSLSPCRIPHPAKKYLSVHGRVFASPERSTTVAWARNVPPIQH